MRSAPQNSKKEKVGCRGFEPLARGLRVRWGRMCFIVLFIVGIIKNRQNLYLATKLRLFSLYHRQGFPVKQLGGIDYV